MNKKSKLLINMLLKGILGFALLGLLLFGCAGSLRYWDAWVFIGSLFLLMLSMGLVLFIKYPDTLEKRLKTNESESSQKGYISIIAVAFLLTFILAGLDYRFAWTSVPIWASALALVIMIIGYGLYAAVMFQNAYASRVVEVQKDQTVISTGLYSVVRHPMYTGSILLFLAMPFVLGSCISLIPMLVYPFVIVLRIKNEETVLISSLKGYTEYMKTTKYKLIPFIW